ncbi:hypothetical protein DM860_002794 [Cuscuta australis]|uniref:feruloyl-CoA 6-hydroxylase n=1 Tax=Cuscuta australis TaxID=267555 RepID=A0A328D4B9_9ASTE|nr:hypothetical protein DM860_002794 [Cuscuta australis]
MGKEEDENGCLNEWPEPIVRVQGLSESGISTIPDSYVRRSRSERPEVVEEIPVIDLEAVAGRKEEEEEEDNDSSSLSSGARGEKMSGACREWGFFQVVNHGVDQELMAEMQEAWREFFLLPAEEKQEYANSPATYEGYGSRLGVEKGAKLDWCDYFFLNFLPISLRDSSKWPRLPLPCRPLTEKYGQAMACLGEKLTRMMSLSLGLKEDRLHQAFGGDQGRGSCLRVNFYPKCPQPDLAFGLSPHSDPGGLTILLPDANVVGLQVFHVDKWVNVKPLPNSLIVNIGDQIQVISNAAYKSVEHRVIVNSIKERVSLAFFYNPGGEVVVKPLDELVTENNPAMYLPMTFNEYRAFIRSKGPQGKSQVEMLKSKS